MKKRLKEAKDVAVGDTLKISGYIWEVSEATTLSDGTVVLKLWLWARPAKTAELRFNDTYFPVTVR